MEVIRGGLARQATRISKLRAPGPLLPNATRPGFDGGLTDDPAARRRELLVVAAICAARLRGAPAIDCPPCSHRRDGNE